MIYSENNNNINLISSGIDIDLSELELPDLFVDFKCRSKLEPEPVDDVWPLHQEKGSAVKFLKFEELKNGTFFKWANLGLFFYLFSSFQAHSTNFATNGNVKSVHTVYSAGIRTHGLWNTNLLP